MAMAEFAGIVDCQWSVELWKCSVSVSDRATSHKADEVSNFRIYGMKERLRVGKNGTRNMKREEWINFQFRSILGSFVW